MSYNPNDPAQRELLRQELTKPEFVELVIKGSDQTIADVLNAVDPDITVRRGKRSAEEVMSAIDGVAFAGLNAGARDYLIALVSPGEVDLSNDVVRASLMAAFPAGSETRARLAAIADRRGSRAEAMFGAGTIITSADIAMVLRPPMDS